MKKSTRNILIALSVIVVIFTAFIGYGIYSVYNFFSKIGTVSESEIPNELKEARILTGNGFVNKSEYFKLDSEQLLKTFGKGSAIQDEKKRSEYVNSQTSRQFFGFDNIKVCGEEIVAVGKFGGFVFAKDGSVSREIIFEQKAQKVKIGFIEHESYRTTLDNVEIYDFEGDGRCEFFSYSSLDGVVIFDSEGKAIWRYGENELDLSKLWNEKSEKEKKEEQWITGAFAGDLNNDGIGELIVTRKNDGIRVFDVNHKEIWFQKDEFPTAKYKIFDTDGDGKNDILEFQGAGSALRNAQNGEKLKDLKLDYGLEDVIFSKDKNGKNNAYFFKIDENKIELFDIENKLLWKSDAPLSLVKKEKPKADKTPIMIGNEVAVPSEYVDDSESIYQPKAVFVKLKADAPEYLAVIGSFISIPRSDLYIYDNTGKLVYHELLPENAVTITGSQLTNGKQEILVGGKSLIWKYDFNVSR